MKIFKVSVKFKLVLVPIARHETKNFNHYWMSFDMIATTVWEVLSVSWQVQIQMKRQRVNPSENSNNIVRSVILKVKIDNNLHLIQLIRPEIHFIYPYRDWNRRQATRNHTHFRIFKKKLVNIDRRVQEKCAYKHPISFEHSPTNLPICHCFFRKFIT